MTTRHPTVTDPETALLLRALTAIRDMEPEPVEGLPDHPQDCAECAKWENHPIQTMCDERSRQFRRRDYTREMNYNAQGSRMRRIAQDALFLADGGTIHGDQPDWLEPSR